MRSCACAAGAKCATARSPNLAREPPRRGTPLALSPRRRGRMRARGLKGSAISIVAGALVAGSAAVTVATSAQSFLFLESGYEQQLYAATQLPADEDGFAIVLGSVAFAPDGDIWVTEC